MKDNKRDISILCTSRGEFWDRPIKVIESIKGWDTLVAFNGPGLDMRGVSEFLIIHSLVSYNYSR